MKYKDRLILLKMTYGELRKINKNFYITMYNNTDIQKLINVHTGNVVEERNVTELTMGDKITYLDGIEESEIYYTYTQPDYSQKEVGLRIYDENGNFIFILPTTNIINVSYKEYSIKSNKLLITFKCGNKHIGYIIINKETKKIDDIMLQVIRIYELTKSVVIDVLDEVNFKSIEFKFE